MLPEAEEERVSNVKVASNQKNIDVANIPAILDTLHEFAAAAWKSSVSRVYEMDAEQLWDTTMDSTRRTPPPRLLGWARTKRTRSSPSPR